MTTRAALLLAAVLTVAALACTKEVATADVGECFERPENTGSISDFETVDCDEPHFGEVYHKFDISGDDFPGDEAVTQEAQDGCLPAFEDYVGIPYEESVYEIFPITPTRETWVEAGDREVICVLIAPDQANIVGSKRGANE